MKKLFRAPWSSGNSTNGIIVWLHQTLRQQQQTARHQRDTNNFNEQNHYRILQPWKAATSIRDSRCCCFYCWYRPAGCRSMTGHTNPNNSYESGTQLSFISELILQCQKATTERKCFYMALQGGSSLHSLFKTNFNARRSKIRHTTHTHTYIYIYIYICIYIYIYILQQVNNWD